MKNQQIENFFELLEKLDEYIYLAAEDDSDRLLARKMVICHLIIKIVEDLSDDTENILISEHVLNEIFRQIRKIFEEVSENENII